MVFKRWLVGGKFGSELLETHLFLAGEFVFTKGIQNKHRVVEAAIVKQDNAEGTLWRTGSNSHR